MTIDATKGANEAASHTRDTSGAYLGKRLISDFIKGLV